MIAQESLCIVCKEPLSKSTRGPKRKTCSYKCRKIKFLNLNETGRRKMYLMNRKRLLEKKLELVREELISLGHLEKDMK